MYIFWLLCSCNILFREWEWTCADIKRTFPPPRRCLSAIIREPNSIFFPLWPFSRLVFYYVDPPYKHRVRGWDWGAVFEGGHHHDNHLDSSKRRWLSSPPPFCRLGSSDDGGEEDNRGASAAHSCLHPVKMSPTAYFGPEATRLPPTLIVINECSRRLSSGIQLRVRASPSSVPATVDSCWALHASGCLPHVTDSSWLSSHYIRLKRKTLFTLRGLRCWECSQLGTGLYRRHVRRVMCSVQFRVWMCIAWRKCVCFK